MEVAHEPGCMANDQWMLDRYSESELCDCIDAAMKEKEQKNAE